jgi:putative ABC transport system permease protein
MLEVFDNVMDVVTIAVAGIGGISLLVGAIGILTMMWIAVSERVREIGLMRAIGATPEQVQRLFLLESVVLTLIGGAGGVALGLALAALLRIAVPSMPVYTPFGYVLAALAVSVATGLLSGLVPARRAAALDPVDALRGE